MEHMKDLLIIHHLKMSHIVSDALRVLKVIITAIYRGCVFMGLVKYTYNLVCFVNVVGFQNFSIFVVMSLLECWSMFTVLPLSLWPGNAVSQSPSLHAASHHRRMWALQQWFSVDAPFSATVPPNSVDPQWRVYRGNPSRDVLVTQLPAGWPSSLGTLTWFNWFIFFPETIMSILTYGGGKV